MKAFFVLLLSLILYAGEDRLESATSSFRKKARDYYKAWAIGYCLGYYKIEDNVEFTYIPYGKRPENYSEDEKEEDWLPGKMVYLGGVEPLKELKAYIDEKKDYFDRNRIGECLGLIVYNYDIDKEIERIIKKYGIDELTMGEAAERVPKKDKIK